MTKEHLITLENADKWLKLENDIGHSEIAQLKSRAQQGDKAAYENLTELVDSQLSFGTAGLRAKMGPGFSRINLITVRLASQGIADYLGEKYHNSDEILVIIGHDHRHNSKEFADATAGTFLAKGIKVQLMRSNVPTPFIPFGVRLYQAQFGVMITASHNPKADNGYKVYGSNGCQIVDPTDQIISTHIQRQHLQLWDIDRFTTSLDASCPDPFDHIKAEYLDRATQLASKLNSVPCPQPIVYTAMHGVGFPIVDELIAKINGGPIIPVASQIHPDPNFSTVEFPNPEEGVGALKLGIETAEKANACLVFANDPDADRFNFAEKDPQGVWKIYTGNEIAAIFAYYLWNKRGGLLRNEANKFAMLASTVSSKLLRKMSQIEGFQFKETLTGFKYLGNKALELEQEGYTVLLATEEAIGFMVSTNVLDKDGITAVVTAQCCASELYSAGKTFYDYLQEIYQKYGFHAQHNSYFFCQPASRVKDVFSRMRLKLCKIFGKEFVESSLSGRYNMFVPGLDKIKITNIIDMYPPSLMITIEYERADVAYWLIIRTSGTEPKIKFYGEASCQYEDREVCQATLKNSIDELCDWLLEPVVNKLVAKSTRVDHRGPP